MGAGQVSTETVPKIARKRENPQYGFRTTYRVPGEGTGLPPNHGTGDRPDDAPIDLKSAQPNTTKSARKPTGRSDDRTASHAPNRRPTETRRPADEGEDDEPCRARAYGEIRIAKLPWGPPANRPPTTSRFTIGLEGFQ